MAGVKVPFRARRVQEIPKAASITKLVSCLDALGMRPTAWMLGGGQLAILGIRPELTLAIEARFDLGETASGKVSAKFAGARVHDPIGVVRNLEFDYSINKPNAKRLMLDEVEAKRRGGDRNARYNDGGQHRFIIADLETATEMNEWLDDWLDTLRVDHKRQGAKKRATKAEKNELAIMTGGTWEG